MKTTIGMHFSDRPILGFILSGLLTVLGFGIGGDFHLQAPPIDTSGFPMWVKDLFQCIAWGGAGITGFVAGHGYWVKHAAPKVKDWKQKRKERKNK